MKKNRKQIYEIDETNDIRYRGPLTYQHLRMLAWLCLAASQVAVLITIAGRIDSWYLDAYGNISKVCRILSDFATPLFLMANFAIILTAKEGYAKLLIRFGILSLAAVGMFFLIYERYTVGLAEAFAGNREGAYALLESVKSVNSKGFVAFNLFLDLFLCTLVMLFLDYTPKKLFSGKKIVIFRLFVLLPIAYEATSVVLKVLASTGTIVLSRYMYPFLTTKPPLGFVAFLAMALFFKRREMKFRKEGKSGADHKKFLQTRTNSLHFSRYAAIILLLAGVLDFILIIVFSGMLLQTSGKAFDYDNISRAVNIVAKWGFGEAAPLVFLAPLMFLFSYNKEPKFPGLNIVITICGVILIIIVYLEGLFMLCSTVATSAAGSLAQILYSLGS